jgi:bifunctional non-homologous end joining protein LigD
VAGRKAAATKPLDAHRSRQACDDTGIASFDMLRSRVNDRRAALYEFDLLDLNGRDQRTLPLENRKARLEGLLRGIPVGMQYNDHVDGDGAEVFAHACKLGLEGIVSKDWTRPYKSGVAKHWLKTKNPNAPGTLRFKD